MFSLQYVRIQFDVWVKYQPSQHIKNYGRLGLAGRTAPTTIFIRSFIEYNTLRGSAATVLPRPIVQMSRTFERRNQLSGNNNYSSIDRFMCLARPFTDKARSRTAYTSVNPIRWIKKLFRWPKKMLRQIRLVRRRIQILKANALRYRRRLGNWRWFLKKRVPRTNIWWKLPTRSWLRYCYPKTYLRFKYRPRFIWRFRRKWYLERKPYWRHRAYRRTKFFHYFQESSRIDLVSKAFYRRVVPTMKFFLPHIKNRTWQNLDVQTLRRRDRLPRLKNFFKNMIFLRTAWRKRYEIWDNTKFVNFQQVFKKTHQRVLVFWRSQEYRLDRFLLHWCRFSKLTLTMSRAIISHGLVYINFKPITSYTYTVMPYDFFMLLTPNARWWGTLRKRKTRQQRYVRQIFSLQTLTFVKGLMHSEQTKRQQGFPAHSKGIFNRRQLQRLRTYRIRYYFSFILKVKRLLHYTATQPVYFLYNTFIYERSFKYILMAALYGWSNPFIIFFSSVFRWGFGFSHVNQIVNMRYY